MEYWIEYCIECGHYEEQNHLTIITTTLMCDCICHDEEL